MIAILAMLPSFLMGWAVVRLLLPHGRGFYASLFELSLSVGVGAGISSLFDFVLTWAGFANRAMLLGAELTVFAAALFFARKRKTAAPAAPAESPWWVWFLRIAAIAALTVLVFDFADSTSANPAGQWDAAGIWNLRARYLTGGPENWRRAVSDEMAAGMLGADHPGYPLLVSGFIARTWIVDGDPQSPAPAALSLIFTLAAMGLLCAALARVSEIFGLLAVLMCLGADAFLSQAVSQYADIPLSFFILGALALLYFAKSPGEMILAGMLAGFAAWTKNEGLPFALAFFAVAGWRLKSDARWVWAAALAPLAAVVALKTILVHGSESMFPKTIGQAAGLIADPSRWARIVESFALNIWNFGVPWAHPLLLGAIAVFAFGWIPKARPWWLLVAPAALLAADFGIYLITTADLEWHLGTSNSRLLVQVWPVILFAFMLFLRVPERQKAAKKRR